MNGGRAERHRERREEARRFATGELAPWADAIDREQATPPSVLAAMRGSGLLGAALPEEWGGGGIEPSGYGLITEEIGRVCSSLRSLMTVHNMSAQAILRFGSPEQKARWLPELCAGRRIIAFALSEPEAGSATSDISTRAVADGEAFRLYGVKKWISYGQVADQFLVFARQEDGPVALIVDRDSEGLAIEPISGIFGTRGAMLAQLRFEGVRVPTDRQLGQAGMGLSLVANFALDHGRFSVAWGSTGLIQACLDACVSYAQNRSRSDGRLVDFQLVRRQLADMLVAHSASRALCLGCAELREQGDPRAIMETSLAKYHASAAAIRVANDAVHLHGANGCSEDYPVGRYLRDATVGGIVEGSHEIHQIALASYALQRPYLD